MPHLVFVYGTLKKGEPNHDLISTPCNGFAQYLGTAETVKTYPLVIASKYNIPYLMKRVGLGYNVRGEVYRVDDFMLSAIDDLEGHPKYYEREQIEVNLANRQTRKKEILSCWTYFLTHYKPFMLELPCLQDYSSNGSHNLPYVRRYKQPDANPHDDVKE
uniref:Gamma-glutamylcyclotransferase family protein n=1 Tax=Strigamia maritima TaxID=126957 RepID=T1JG34_STRMM